MLIAILILAASQPGIVERYDALEVNHVADRFTQLIAWEWCPQYRRYHCQGYLLIDSSDELPVHRGGLWRVQTERGEIVGKHLRQTWTANDPEVDNRRIFPSEFRRSLLLRR